MKKCDACWTAASKTKFEVITPRPLPDAKELKDAEFMAAYAQLTPLPPSTVHLVMAATKASKESKADPMKLRVDAFVSFKTEFEFIEALVTVKTKFEMPSIDYLRELTSEFARVISKMEQNIRKTTGDTTINWWWIDSLSKI
ncbi:MAG: hypothetical protein Hyperionvirus4_142 [Hyperionvirus sp.]|uniref:Uncharacterized protein n=1 Tax=Hyperionvirus sp. TaxID=2487770 RepID=A0A3G5A7F9_9VIRU|nr:MAG: hypothetical protein Hyperionvirus4_142 [Hyperionvirus sp.]